LRLASAKDEVLRDNGSQWRVNLCWLPVTYPYLVEKTFDMVKPDGVKRGLTGKWIGQQFRKNMQIFVKLRYPFSWVRTENDKCRRV
jgi:hypothetical protein